LLACFNRRECQRTIAVTVVCGNLTFGRGERNGHGNFI
jgi:hypothetical protein